nr:phosphotransferase [Nocardia neocaledoniensis]
MDTTRIEFTAATWPLGHGLIHGDAWAGNLLWDTTRPPHTQALLGDWDWAGIGPRKVDLIPTWHAAIRYGRDQAWVNDFIDTYRYDLTDYPDGYHLLRRMRDLVQLSGPLRRSSTSPQHGCEKHPTS